LSSFIVDASVTLPWCFPDEATPATEALLDRLYTGDEAIVPAHWPTEVMNGLVMAFRRKRIPLNKVLDFEQALAALPIHIEPPLQPGTWLSVLTASTDTNLTVYDAAYLQLARERKLPLATFDADLQKAAKADAIPLLF
jgi:predicted nucleic acid-binding protein